jgi:16S rRNA U1498 N3-methylase RsmE
MGSQHMEGGLLLIGPEGDFTPVELKTLLEAGAVPVCALCACQLAGKGADMRRCDFLLKYGDVASQVGLGPLRLRAETAAIALLSTLMMCAADVR